MKIKICGITEIETLNFLIENGVDYVGFIFYENSPRNVTHAFINEIKNIDFQNLHENLNQKVDSISERVPEYDFEGPGPQNP